MKDFEYPCPHCGSVSQLHGDTCDYITTTGSEYTREQIETAYFALITELSFTSSNRNNLIESTTEYIGERKLVGDCLDYLVRTNRVFDITDQEIIRSVDSISKDMIPDEHSGSYYYMPTHEEWKEAISYPQFEPIRTIYENGSYPGCHDNAVFSLVAYFQMVGLSWEETVEIVEEWFEESGTWERGGFEEDSPTEVITNKKHVYENEYGWREKGEAAKSVIDSNTA